MKKLLSLFIGLMVFAIPFLSQAMTVKSDGNVGQTEVIFGNLYLTGGAPVVAGAVQGDLIAVGGTIVVTGSVDEDALILAGNTNISGKILGDLRVFGGSVFIDGTVNGEVVATGGDVRIGPNAVIQGDLLGSGGSVTVNPTAKIFGKQTIQSEGPDGDDAQWKKGFEKFVQVAFLLGQVMTIIGLLLIGMAFFGLFPNIVNKVVQLSLQKGQFWKNVGLGLIMMIGIPVSAVLCFMSGIGVMLGFILAFIFALFMLVNMVSAGYIFGALLYKLIKRPKKLQMGWGIVIGGIALLHLVSLVPYVGFLVSLVFMLLSWGSLAKVQWALAKGIK